jgi:hypothetical protein
MAYRFGCAETPVEDERLLGNGLLNVTSGRYGAVGLPGSWVL